MTVNFRRRKICCFISKSNFHRLLHSKVKGTNPSKENTWRDWTKIEYHIVYIKTKLNIKKCFWSKINCKNHQLSIFRSKQESKFWYHFWYNNLDQNYVCFSHILPNIETHFYNSSLDTLNENVLLLAPFLIFFLAEQY